MSISGSSNFIIEGHNTFNNVGGDQITRNTIYTRAVNINAQRFPKQSKYDQFRDVKLGDVIYVKEMYQDGCFDYEWRNGACFARHRGQRTVYNVELFGSRAKFTAIAYDGEEAQSLWDKDFNVFSRVRKPNTWQLFGFNSGDVPLLIFHHEMAPLAHFYKPSFWGDVFLHLFLSHDDENLGAYFPENVWLNSKGVLCNGIDGPAHLSDIDFGDIQIIQVEATTTIEMLEEQHVLQCIKELTNGESLIDFSVLLAAKSRDVKLSVTELFPGKADSYHPPFMDRFDPHAPKDFPQWDVSEDLPMEIIGHLRHDTIYSPSLEPIMRWPKEKWHPRHQQSLHPGTILQNGLTRFNLNPRNEVILQSFEILTAGLWEIWLSQCTRVIDCHEETKTAQDYFFLNPPIFLLHSVSVPTSKQDSDSRPLYLFVYPPPVSVLDTVTWARGHARTHFWSLDDSGQPELPKEEYERWGVPTLEPSLDSTSERSIFLRSWPNEIYTAMHDWQVARGFDPTTSDFARHMKYPELEIIEEKKTKSRFKDVTEVMESEDLSSSCTVADTSASKVLEDVPATADGEEPRSSEGKSSAACKQDTKCRKSKRKEKWSWKRFIGAIAR